MTGRGSGYVGSAIAEQDRPRIFERFFRGATPRKVTVVGNRVNLTPNEFGILQQLMLNQGRVVSHRQLLHSVWGEAQAPETQLISNHQGKRPDQAPAQLRYRLLPRSARGSYQKPGRL